MNDTCDLENIRGCIKCCDVVLAWPQVDLKYILLRIVFKFAGLGVGPAVEVPEAFMCLPADDGRKSGICRDEAVLGVTGALGFADVDRNVLVFVQPVDRFLVRDKCAGHTAGLVVIGQFMRHAGGQVIRTV